jgi:hypothetical protein
MTLTIGSIFRRPKQTLSQGTLPPKNTREMAFSLDSLQPFGNLFLGDSALFDHFPVRFRDIHRR